MNLKDVSSPSLLKTKWPKNRETEINGLLFDAYMFFASHPQLLEPWRESIDNWRTRAEKVVKFKEPFI